MTNHDESVSIAVLSSRLDSIVEMLGKGEAWMTEHDRSTAAWTARIEAHMAQARAQREEAVRQEGRMEAKVEELERVVHSLRNRVTYLFAVVALGMAVVGATLGILIRAHIVGG